MNAEDFTNILVADLVVETNCGEDTMHIWDEPYMTLIKSLPMISQMHCNEYLARVSIYFKESELVVIPNEVFYVYWRDRSKVFSVAKTRDDIPYDKFY